MQDLFFNSWQNILRTLLVGGGAYIILIFLLRISGKRTLSKMNMFDFTITVAFGSTLATVILSSDVSLSQGSAALALLVMLQFIITFTEVRRTKFRALIKAKPSLIFFEGKHFEQTMLKERITKEDVQCALRKQGIIKESSVSAVILETDGSFSIVDEKSLSLLDIRDAGVSIHPDI